MRQWRFNIVLDAYRKIWHSLEGVIGVWIFSTSPKFCRRLDGIAFKHQMSPIRVFARPQSKTSYRILKRGTGSYNITGPSRSDCGNYFAV